MATSDDLIRQASAALSSDSFAEALDLADQAIAQTPLNVDAYVFKGIALAQLDQPEEATRAFRRAISINASSAKAYYNFATHLYQLGQLEEAKEKIEKALEIQPAHSAAQDLHALLVEETKSIPVVEPEPPVPSAVETSHPYGANVEPELQPIAYRAPEFERPAHSIPFIAKIGKGWTGIGWAISIASMFNMMIAAGLAMKFVSDPQNKIDLGIMGHLFVNATQAQPIFLTIAMVLLLATSVWSILDVIDRGSRDAVWAIILFLSALPWCIFAGLQWITMPLYLLFGRKP